MSRPFASHPMSSRAAISSLRSPWRHALYVLWALPVSIWAFFLLPLAVYRAKWHINSGVLEISSPALGWFLSGFWFRSLTGGDGFAAATIGHVIVARNAQCMLGCRDHEHMHVRQCERWGLLFPFAYVGAGLHAAWAARSLTAYYRDNTFEIEARRAEIGN